MSRTLQTLLRPSLLAIAVAIAAPMLSAPLMAAPQASSVRAYNLPAAPLSTTLTQIASQAGIALSLGVLYLAVWVMCASAGPETYAKFRGFNSSIVGRFVLGGWLFCGDVLIADNFCNGETWQVGLRDYADAIDAAGGKLTLVVTPLRRGVRVKVTSSMAARLEQSDACVADVTDVYATPVYHMPVGE